MASVASHPTRPLDGHQLPDYSTHPSPHSAAKSLLASSWQTLEQPPPPTLREILGAYRTRGDGDREMLLAMLSAKSAEDQRIASVASLHRSLLEYYQIVPASPPVPHHDIPCSYVMDHPTTNGSRSPPTSYSRSYLPRSPKTRYQDGPVRKRHRGSESPPSPYRSMPSPSSSQIPSSPYSSTRSDSAPRSPHARGAMAIDSLLSQGASEKSWEEGESEHRSHRIHPPDCSGHAAPHLRQTSNAVSPVSG